MRQATADQIAIQSRREGGPVVCIDEVHRNHHTVAGRYAPLARLLENDGYSIARGEATFGAAGPMRRSRSS